MSPGLDDELSINIKRNVCVFVGLSSIAGRTAGPTAAKLGGKVGTRLE